MSGLRFALLAALGALAPLGAPTARADVIPLVVSVGVNRSFDGRLGPLSYAETDAERFSYAMTTVGGVPASNLTLLRSPTADEFVSAVQLLTRSRRREDGDGPNRVRLILYFSGHADDRGLHFRGGPLSRARLHELLREVDVATRIVVLDSCFSGSIAAKGVEPAEAFSLPKLDMDELTGSVFLTASSAREVAYESEELSGSIFTHHLVAGLNGGADGNDDGLVTVDELYQYVYRETRLRSMGYPGATPQRPEYHAELRGQGAIVLAQPRRGVGHLRVDPGIMGSVHLASTGGLGSYTVHGQAIGAKDFAVPEGAYRALIRRGDRIGEATVLIARGETTELRAGQFNWHTIDMQVAEVTKGSTMMAASTVTMLAVRQAMGEAEVKGVDLELGRHLMDMVAQRARVSLFGYARAYESEGTLRARDFVALGASASLGLVMARSSDTMRGLAGFSVDHEWQWWDAADPDRDPNGEFHRAWTPSAHVGAMLPMTGGEGRRWSLSLRRVFKWQQDHQRELHRIDQYLIGVVIE